MAVENIYIPKIKIKNKQYHFFHKIEMTDKILIGRKSEESITQGYVFAPYIPIQTTDVIVEYSGRKSMRKYKINKIFELQLDIKCESPTSITSRYAKKVINNRFYQTVQIKKSS